MDDDEYENQDEKSFSKYKTYTEFLDRFVGYDDRLYLEDEDLARDVRELYAVNKGDIKNKEDFDRKKLEEEKKKEFHDDKTEKLPFSHGKTFEKDSFLWHLQQREYEVGNGRKYSIIFIRYKEPYGKEGREVSAYIDYRDKLKNENMDDIFNGKKDLIPKPTDLSYYNWSLQRVHSSDSTFFRVDAGPIERLSFRNNSDRKIINVDLEFLEKHMNPDVKRIPIDLSIGKKKKEVKNKFRSKQKEPGEEEKDLENNESEYGYKQIVIFDYETSSK
jgi:hypothetical protein